MIETFLQRNGKDENDPRLFAAGPKRTSFACRIRTSSDRPHGNKQLARQMIGILVYCHDSREKRRPHWPNQAF